MKVTSDLEINIVEGGNAVPVTMKALVPPSFTCDSGDNLETCMYKVHASWSRADADVRCKDGSTMLQAVLVWDNIDGVTPFCGLEINMGNWDREHIILVKAKIDGLYDGNQERYLRLTSEALSDTVLSTSDVATIQVSDFNII